MKKLKRKPMFRNRYVSVLGLGLIGLMAVDCSDDDGNAPANRAPEAFSFNIIGPTTGLILSQTPTFNWGTSTDPDGDAVTYDVYLSMVADPLVLFPNASDLTNNSFTISDEQALLPSTDYHLQIKAKDGKGGETLSNILEFETQDE